MKFKKFLKDMREETTTADIATVNNKLDMVKRENKKGKKCKKHKQFNCEICEDEKYN